MLTLHILKQGQRLAESAQRVLYTRFAIRFGRCVFRFEKRPNGLRDVLDDAKHLLRNVLVLL